LLHAIEKADVETYRQLVSEEVTCFEPETGGAQVKSRDMHLFFVKNSTAPVRIIPRLIDVTQEEDVTLICIPMPECGNTIFFMPGVLNREIN